MHPWSRDFAPGRGARLTLAAGAGVALTLAQPPVGLWPLVFAAVPLLIVLTRGLSAGRAAWTGWVAGTAFFGSGLFWIAEAFFVDAARHGRMAPFAILFLAGGLALFWAAGFWAAQRLFAAGPLRGIGLALAWTLAEAARAHVLTGFPWALPAHVWADTPVLQVLALTGPLGLSALTLLAAALVAIRHPAGAGAAAVLIAAGWGWGMLRLQAPAPSRTAPLTVRLVQPNAAQGEKWDAGLYRMFFDRQLAATAAPGAPDVVIWPETAVPYLIGEDDGARAMIGAAGVPVILGARRRDGTGRWWNALFVLAPGGAVAAVYDKHHLVPFGEYVPFAERTGMSAFVGGSFTPGTGPVTLSGAGLPPFQPLICYEAIFAEELGTTPRPDWLVQITNDAWFGASAGPYQHFAQARMRAIEQGLPLARAANTGISGMIDPYGRIVAALPLLTAGHVDAVLPGPLAAPPPYARWGDGPWLALVVVAGLLARWVNHQYDTKLTASG